jgi:hypothetical protein
MNLMPGGGRFLLFFCCLSAVFLSPACIPPALLGPPAPPYSEDQIHAILDQVTAQQNLVNTLFCTGTLTFKQGAKEQEANITIVGKKSPFQVKVEITHPWGPPIANLLVDNDRFTLVFFPEKRIFLGSVKKGIPQRSFPVPLDPSAMWAFVRGYPPVPEYKKAVSPGKGIISLLDKKNNLLQRLEFYPSPLRPQSCSFPAIGITQYYEALKKDGAVDFAQKVVLNDTVHERSLILKVKHALFNPHLPSGVFQVAKPEKFKTIDLSREKPQHQ